MRNLHGDFNAYADPMRFMLPQGANVNGNPYSNVSDDNGNDTHSKFGPVLTPDSTESSASSPSSSQSSSSLSTSSQDSSKQNKKRKSGKN